MTVEHELITDLNSDASPADAPKEAPADTKQPEKEPELQPPTETEPAPTDAKVNGDDAHEAKAEDKAEDAQDKPSEEATSTKTEEPAEAPVSEPTEKEDTLKEQSSNDLPSQPADVDMSEAPPAETAATSKSISEEAPEETKIEADTTSSPTEAQLPVSEKQEPADTEMTDAPAKPEDTPLPSTESALPTSEVDIHPASLSQLNIENDETMTSPVTATVPTDASMTDVTTEKVAREREDDNENEGPSPKRARTDPKDDEPIVASGGAGAVADKDALPPTELRLWKDEEHSAKPITQHQRREIRKVLARIKKTKHGYGFRDSVQKLWPALWDTYVAKIERPMDLGEIDRSIRDPQGNYTTWGDLKRDLGLIYDNTLKYNGPDHHITAWAAYAIRNTWEDVIIIPDEEPVKPKAAPKPKPVRESRTANIVDAAATRRESAGSSQAARANEVAKAEIKAEPAAAVRRDSTMTEADRPKRAIRAPKSKDIDYSAKPARKKLKPELQFCDEVLSEVMSAKHYDLNQWFLEPVDAEGLKIPTYYSVVKKPMDLGKVQRMLHGGELATLKDFEKTVRLIFTNCYSFNGPVEQGNPVSAIAHSLEQLFNAQMKGKDAWLAKHSKANSARQASASNASDEDEDEDDVDAAPAGNSEDVEKYDAEVKVLETKLKEETEKLTTMLLADTPQQAMIKLQQGMLSMIQEALLKAKTSLSDARQKGGKPAKKPKAAKGKAAGGAGGRKAGGAGAQAKKPAKKAAGKKNLTAADKDAIANAINDLDYPHLERAIDIIKQDTGQNVSRKHNYHKQQN